MSTNQMQLAHATEVLGQGQSGTCKGPGAQTHWCWRSSKQGRQDQVGCARTELGSNWVFAEQRAESRHRKHWEEANARVQARGRRRGWALSQAEQQAKEASERRCHSLTYLCSPFLLTSGHPRYGL